MNQEKQVGVQQGPVKYRLAPTVWDAKEHRHVQSKRSNRRNRGKGRRKNDFGKYGGNYWEAPGVDFFELSSIECGSYADKADICEREDIDPKLKGKKKLPKNARKLKWGNKRRNRNDRLSNPQNFSFNPSALEYIPPENRKQIKHVKFTLRELLDSVKGQELPVMPCLQPFYRGRSTNT